MREEHRVAGPFYACRVYTGRFRFSCLATGASPSSRFILSDKGKVRLFLQDLQRFSELDGAFRISLVYFRIDACIS